MLKKSVLLVLVFILLTISIQARLGDVNDISVSELRFIPWTTSSMSIARLNDNVVVVAFIDERTSNEDGYIATINISDDGTVENRIDLWMFSADRIEDTELIRIGNSNTFAVLYYTNFGSTATVLRTFNVTDDGEIDATSLDSWNFCPGPPSCWNPRIIPATGDIYLLVHNRPTSQEKVLSVKIEEDGTITGIDNLVLNPNLGPGDSLRDFSITNANGDIYALVSTTSPDKDGRILTFTMDANGNIGSSILDSKTFAHSVSSPQITKIDEGVVAIYYGTGFKTLSVQANGNIGSDINSYPSGGASSNFFNIHDNTYFVANGNSVDTYKIRKDGTIRNQVSTSAVTYIEDVTYLRDNLYAIARRNGFIRTINITSQFIVPSFSKFSLAQGTTNFNEVGLDLNDISNMTLANVFGKIIWSNNWSDADTEDYDSNINIGDRYVSVNAPNLHPNIDQPALVNLSDFNCSDFDLYYATGFFSSAIDIINSPTSSLVATEANIGGHCLNVGICKFVECSNNNLVFTAQHFDSFGGNTTGGGGPQPPPGGGGVPEFSDYAMMLIIILVISGFFVIRKNTQ